MDHSNVFSFNQNIVESLVLEWYYGLKRQPVRKRHGKLQVGQTILVALVLPLLYRKIQETFDRETGGAVGRSLDRQVSMSEEAQTSRDERLRLRREYEEKLLSRFKHHVSFFDVACSFQLFIS